MSAARSRVVRGPAAWLVAGVLSLLGACTGAIGGQSPDSAEPFEAELREAAVLLGEAGGFADERGGGIFADADGHVVRLRIDGTLGRLESHPGNARPPGRALRVFPAGPFSALVAAEAGLYLAESGWLIEPPWGDALEARGLVAVALDGDGVTWLAHARGLFRLEGGQLAELKVASGSLTGLTALATAPAADGSPAVWLAHGPRLGQVRKLARARYEVIASGLEPSALGGADITQLAAVTAAPGAPGALWLATKDRLMRHDARGFRSEASSGAPEALLGSGRWLWLRAGGALYRYDADGARWGEVRGLSGAPTLLAAEAGGSVWLRDGARALAVSAGSVPRLFGVFEGVRLHEPELRVRAQFPAAEAPLAVTFALDDAPSTERTRDEARAGEGAADTLEFALGGFDAAGSEQPTSIAALSEGLHTLTVSARFEAGVRTRRLTFERRGVAREALSYARDIAPIFSARCAHCHARGGPGRDLSGYTAWLADKDEIVSAVVEQRMPADGPLDAAERARIQQWAASGASP